VVRKFSFVFLLSNLSGRRRNRFDRRLFFREQAERLTIGIVGGEALRPSRAQEADAVVADTQDRDHARRICVAFILPPRRNDAWAVPLRALLGF